MKYTGSIEQMQSEKDPWSGVAQCLECDNYIAGDPYGNLYMEDPAERKRAMVALWESHHTNGYYYCNKHGFMCADCYRNSRHLREYSVYQPEHPRKAGLCNFSGLCCRAWLCYYTFQGMSGQNGGHGSFRSSVFGDFTPMSRRKPPKGIGHNDSCAESDACKSIKIAMCFPFQLALFWDWELLVNMSSMATWSTEKWLNNKYGLESRGCGHMYCCRWCVHAQHLVEMEARGEPQHWVCCTDLEQRRALKHTLRAGPDPFDLPLSDTHGRLGAWLQSMQKAAPLEGDAAAPTGNIRSPLAPQPPESSRLT